MSANQETGATWAYHDGTKHTWESVRRSAQMLDMTNQPRPWKLYAAELPTVDLGSSVGSSGATALGAIGPPTGADPSAELTLSRIAALLLLSAGVTKYLAYPGGTMRFRAAACTGALYHIELYLVAGDLPGLPAGVYHYGAHDNALRLLREGDYRGALAQATAGEPAVSGAQAVVAYTTTYWRNAWKYGPRTYRHAYWDSGVIIANMLAAAAAHGVAASVVAGFVDDDVDRLLGVDGTTEATVALVPLGRFPGPVPNAAPVEPLALATVPLSRNEIDYPAVRAMHAASSLGPDDDVAAWRLKGAPPTEPATSAFVALPEDDDDGGTRTIEDTIVRRGSSRRFERTPIPFADFATMLRTALHRVPLDATAPNARALAEPYVIANDVDGLPFGTYRYRHDGPDLEQLRIGDTREAATQLALEQSLGGDAAFNVYFLADLGSLLGQLGNRAYRAAHLDAAVAAGRLYLAAYAMGYGATGLTFYDDAVTDFFGPTAAGKSVMFLMAVGVPARRGTA